MSRIRLAIIFAVVCGLFTNAYAADRIYRKSIEHFRGNFTESKSWNERIDLPQQWANEGFRFYRYEMVKENARIQNANLSDYALTFVFRISKTFVESVDASATVLVWATNGVNDNVQTAVYTDSDINSVPTQQEKNYGQGWYAPNQDFQLQLQQNRRIRKVRVRWTDAGGNARGTLYIDGRSYGRKDVKTNYNGVYASWNVNRAGTYGSIRIDTDNAKIYNAEVHYTDGYVQQIYPQNNNTYPNNNYNPYYPNNNYPNNNYNPYYPNNNYNPYTPQNPYYPNNNYNPGMPYTPNSPNWVTPVPQNPTTNDPNPVTPAVPNQTPPSNTVQPTNPSAPSNPSAPQTPGAPNVPGNHTPMPNPH